jgi:hypothetical protein
MKKPKHDEPLLLVETGNQSPEALPHFSQGATGRGSVYALLPNHQEGVARAVQVVRCTEQVA